MDANADLKAKLPSRHMTEAPERAALDLFDRLRLRAPFAQAFAALGFDGEEGWRVAARLPAGLNLTPRAQ